MKWENVTSQENQKDFEGHDVIFFLLSFFSTSFSAITDQMILLPIRSTLASWLPLTQIPFNKKPKKAIDLLEITRFTCQVRPRPRKITILFLTTQVPSKLLHRSQVFAKLRRIFFFSLFNLLFIVLHILFQTGT